MSCLTANSDAADWWKGVVGPNHVIDPEKYFIVCANILGTCYGSTGPLSNNPATEPPLLPQFSANYHPGYGKGTYFIAPTPWY